MSAMPHNNGMHPTADTVVVMLRESLGAAGDAGRYAARLRTLKILVVKPKEVAQTQWWLMWGAFPNLNWARLRVFTDGTADVFDMDGRTLEFPNEEEARMSLAEDEYSELSVFDEEDEDEWGIPLRSLAPPTGESDDELLPQMYVPVD